jgi:hypothetical protein
LRDGRNDGRNSFVGPIELMELSERRGFLERLENADNEEER